MKYIVLEIQTNADGSVGTLTYAFDDQNQAESKYHQVLAAGAISELPMHSAILITNDCTMLKSDVYYH